MTIQFGGCANERAAGKIVVYVNGGPAELPGPLKSYARTAPLTKAPQDARAVGVISIRTPNRWGFRGLAAASSASQSGDAVGRRLRRMRSSAAFGDVQSCGGGRIVRGIGAYVCGVAGAADAQKPLARFALGKGLKATVTMETCRRVAEFSGEVKRERSETGGRVCPGVGASGSSGSGRGDHGRRLRPRMMRPGSERAGGCANLQREGETKEVGRSGRYSAWCLRRRRRGYWGRAISGASDGAG